MAPSNSTLGEPLGQGRGDSVGTELREQGRGITGALLVVGLSFLYTMETWWLAWRLSVAALVAYAFVGLAGVLVVLRYSGFRSDEEGHGERSPRRLVVNFTELLVQSFVAAYGTLLLFGIVEPGDPLAVVARLGLVQVVPLGLGAGLANELLGQADERSQERSLFPDTLPILVIGAVFFSFPLAPTEEMVVVALQSGWWRTALVVVVTLLVVHLVLYELQFRGQQRRVEERSIPLRAGATFMVYLVGVVVATAMLLAFGHFYGTTLSEHVQLVVVLGFPASVGAAAGDVIL